MISLYENIARLLGSFEKNEICRDALSLINFNYLTDFYIFALDWHDATHALLLALQQCILSRIQLFISSVAIKVIDSLFDHCHHENKGQRSNICEEKANFEKGKELAYGNDKEEHIEKELEFVVEHLKHEGEAVVLLIVKSVGDEVARFCSPLYAKLTTFLRNGQVKIAFAGIAAAHRFNLNFFIIILYG